VSRPGLVPIQPRIQCVLGTLSLRIKRSGREADYSALSGTEVKNVWNWTSSWRGVQLSTGTTLHLARAGYVLSRVK
jgi:hypothetical protein